MLDDRRLQSLLRMAGEVEDFERDALAAAASPASSRRSWRPLTIGLASAASVALTAGIVWLSIGTGSSGGAGSIGGSNVADVTPPVRPVPEQYDARALHDALAVASEYGWPIFGVGVRKPEALPVAAVDNVGSVVLSFVQDESGAVRCVRWSDVDAAIAAGASLVEKAPGELVGLSFPRTCDRTGGRLLVVGLEGPMASLPRTDARAAELASCIAGSDHPCAHPVDSYADAAISCLPQDVRIKVETLALDR
jgi:hypothetical protein